MKYRIVNWVMSHIDDIGSFLLGTALGVGGTLVLVWLITAIVIINK